MGTGSDGRRTIVNSLWHYADNNFYKIYDCIMIHLALYGIETSDMIKLLGAGLCQDFPKNNCGSFPG